MTNKERYWLRRRLTNDKIEKQCSRCNKWFEKSTENFFLLNKSYPERGYHGECKKCSSIRTKITQKKNPNIKQIKHDRYEKFKVNHEYVYRNYYEEHKNERSEYGKGWRQRNPEKCRWYTSLHRIHDITPSEERLLLEVFDYKCAYCGMPLEEHKKIYKQKLHNDHVDEDGYNDLRNDVPACKRCNTSKHESELEDWYFKQKFFDKNKYNKIIWWITEGYKDYIEEKPPYKIIRKQNDDKKTFHWELWTVDEYRNIMECIGSGNKKKDLNIYIEEYFDKP